MDSASTRVTLQVRGSTGAAAELARDAAQVVQYWLEQWSDLSESALAHPITIRIDLGAGGTKATPVDVGICVDESEIHDAESARSLVLAAALDGLAQACLANPRQPSLEVCEAVGSSSVESSDGDQIEIFGEGEMSIFAYVGIDGERSGVAFEDMDVMLDRELRGVAVLQDSTVVKGFGQWVIGRSDD